MAKTMFYAGWFSVLLTFLSTNPLKAQTTLCNELVISSTQTNIACKGATTGTATVTPTGGTGPYTYLWSNGQTTQTITGLAAGTYTVTVKDNSCNPSGVELVTNGNFDSGNTGFFSAYSNCQSNDCLVPEGRYAVGTNANTYHDNFTGLGYGGSGRFMIVNGHGTPNTNVWCQTINGIQPNTQYVFWTWVSSVNPVSPAKLQFSINGVPLGNVFTAPLPVGTWSQFYITWNSGANTSANICVVNQNTTANGNDFGLDGITFQKCVPCTKTATITITEPANGLNATISSPTNVSCFGGTNGSATVTASGGTAPYTYSWTGGGGNSATASNLAAGSYTVTVTDSKGCTKTATATITQPASALSTTISSTTHVSCFGGNNGSATVTASGGTSPYTYSWTNGGGNAATASNLAAGFYTVTVTDSKGCTSSKTVSITQPASGLSVSIGTPTMVSCRGGNNGSATATASGGTGPYTYSWTNGGGNAATASNLAAGNYTVTVTDNKGCTATATTTITQPAASLSGTIGSIIHVSCSGGNNGSATVTATGGTSPYTYSWSNGGGNAATASNLTAGSYTVTITDNKGCTATATTTINQPAAPLSASISSSTNVNCFGGNNGAATVTASGGTGPYTYSWNHGPTTTTVSGLTAGNYTVTVTDSKGCISTATANITQPASGLTTTITSTTHVNCFGGNTGSATVTASGGTSPYTYSWTNGGGNAATASNLIAGSYTVTVTDSKGCTSSKTVSITQPASGLSSSITSSTNINCFNGTTGAATVTASGGTSPYTYLWNNSATTASISNVGAGTYSVTVTDNKGCTSTSTVTLTQPASGLTSSITSSTNINCFNGTTGAATVTASGGTGPYTYLWNNSATTASISNVGAGTYSVTVTDNKGCTSISSVTLTQPAAGLTSSITSSTNVNCFGATTGAATVTASGGTAPYTYVWSNSATTASISNVGAGTYTVTVTDNKGCTSISSVNITQPASGLSANIGSSANVSCFGQSTGAAAVTAAGGTAPYTYLWSNNATTPSISNLPAGTYSVTVTDNKGCTASTSVNITQPASGLSTTISSTTHVNCYGGSTGAATVTASGGTAPYTYLWSNSATTATATGLSAGSYTVTVIDDKGCTSIKSVTITQPAAALTSSITNSTNVGCFSGNSGGATVTATGGTAPYTYLWNTGITTPVITNLGAGTYSVTVTDNKGCTSISTVNITQPAAGLTSSISSSTNINCYGQSTGAATVLASGGTGPYTYAWSNSATTASISNVAAGTYNVTVTDNQGCTSNQTVTLTQPAAALNATGVATNVLCYGNNTGAIDLTVTGGTGPYTYNWSNSATSQDITSLTSGSYNVTVTDNKGCTFQYTGTVTQPAATISVQDVISDVLCNAGNTGAIDITVAGGTGPYTYLWSNGATTQDINSVVTGSYSVNITDHNGCTFSHTAMVNQPANPLSIKGTKHHITCNGFNNGSIEVVVMGGSWPYTLNWSTGGTGNIVSNLAPGIYGLVVTDVNNCTYADSFQLTEPAILVTASSLLDPVQCYGMQNGEIALQSTGGTGPYEFLWNTGDTLSAISNLGPGLYTVVTTDSNNCTRTDSFTVSMPQPMSVIPSVSQVISCNGVTDGEISTVTTGGNGNYTYNWSNGSNQPVLQNIGAGTYQLIVTDGKGCQDTVQHTITEPTPMNWAGFTNEQVSCNGNNDAWIDVLAAGGTAPYDYQWSNGDTTSMTQNLTPGTYTIVASDDHNCQLSQTFTVTEPALLVASAGNIDPVQCFGLQNGEITVNLNGGTAPYQLNWNTGDTTLVLSNLGNGAYTLNVTDSNGCTTTQTFTVTQPQPLNVLPATAQEISCFGAADGAITAVITGGNGGYEYDWSTGDSTSVLSSVSAGTYTLIISDVKGCQDTVQYTITEPALLTTALLNHTDPNCNGSTDGSAQIIPTGGTSPYAYNWSTSDITPGINNLGAGTYTVTVTDDHGCSYNDTVTLGEPAVLMVDGSNVDGESCAGYTDGSIGITVIGGTSPYDIQWDNGDNGSQINNLPPGTYTYTVTDDHGCTGVTGTFTITNGNVVTAPSITLSGDGHLCNGETVTLNASTSGYNLQWSDGSNGPSLTVSGGGSYYVTATDSIGCFALSDTTDITASTVDVDIDAPGQTCQNEDFNISATGADSYVWSTGQTGPDITLVITADSPVTVWGTDTYGCSDSATTMLFVYEPVAAENDSIELEFNQEGNVMILENDTNAADVTIIQWPAHGSLVLQGNMVIYQPDPGYYGEDSVIYVACHAFCASLCDTAVVKFKIQEDPTLFIPEVITPNNDGKNDFFVIEGLENYPENSLVIMNRWGDVLFAAEPYLNDWDGTANSGLTAVKTQVTNSVYYYILKLTPTGNPVKGFIEVKK